MILDTLAKSARDRVENRKREKSAEQIRREAKALGSDTGFPFRRALEQPGISFICEVKKASPSRGIIAEDFPYLAIAEDYAAAGAAAISVLTERNIFWETTGICGRSRQRCRCRCCGRISRWTLTRSTRRSFWEPQRYF